MTDPIVEITLALFPSHAPTATGQPAWGMRSRVRIDPAAVRLIGRQTAETLLALPVRQEGRILLVAMADPGDTLAVAALSQRTGLRIRPALTDALEIHRALDRLYAEAAPSSDAEFPHIPIGRLLIERGLITRNQLAEILTSQERTGIRFGQLAVARGFVNRLALAEVLADQLRMPSLNLREQVPPAEAVRLLDPAAARRLQAVPVRWVGPQLLVAMADPTNTAAQAELGRILQAPLIFAVASELDIEWVLARAYSDTYIEESVSGLLYRMPEESAYETITDPQIIALLAVVAVATVGLLAAPLPFLVGVNAIAAALYLAMSGYRLWLSWWGAATELTIAVSENELAELDERELPVFTILVPLYREQGVLRQLVDAIEALDYPKGKLDVKLLMEEKDHETIEAARALQPPGYLKFVVVPDSAPRTKPKACNYGLISALGEFTVIYDAEDQPEPLQLRRVVAAFAKAPTDVICLQAKLNFYNRSQNLLARWFTAEYSNWFDLVLPGLDRQRVPIPLGGTSNHFYTEKLRELGAWDPFNVTEDADLGIRMFKRGYRTAIIDSTTYEEANSDWRNWIRQRSRWVKGYMQTWLVHMRHPLQLLRAVGPRAFSSFHLTVAGAPLVFLLNPVYWTIISLWFLERWEVIRSLFPGWVYYISALNLLVGNFIFLYVNLAGTYRRGYYELSRVTLLSPLYWLMMSLAAWKAVWQLITRPYYWEKTIHGLHCKPRRPEGMR